MKPKINPWAIASNASVALSQLQELAKKDRAALEALTNILATNIRDLNDAALRDPEHYGWLARRCAKWPGLITPDKDRVEANAFFVSHLEVGSETGMNFSGKQWTRRTPEVRVALRLLSALALSGRNKGLPPLTRATALQWWNAAKPIFIQRYGEAFEDHPVFKDYGKKSQPQSFEPLARWQIRKKILSSMAQAFRSIARKS